MKKFFILLIISTFFIQNINAQAYAGPDQIVCTDTAELNATHVPDAVDESWSIVSGAGTFDNSNDPLSVVRNIAPGDNIYRWTLYYTGYSDYDDVIITRNTNPIAGFTVSESEFCPPKNVIMDNISNYSPGYTPPDEFRWFVNGAFLETTYSVDENVEHLFTNTAQIDSAYTIKMIAYDYETGCNDTAVQNVLAFAIPYVAFDLDPHITRYPQSTVEIENLSDRDLWPYLWDFGDGEHYYQVQWVGAIEHEYLTWGTFYITLTATNSGSCDGVFRDSVVIYPPCPYSYNEPGIIAEGCQPLFVQFYDQVYFVDSLEWKFDSFGDSISNESNPIYTYEEPGEYYVRLWAWHEGCNSRYERIDTVIVYPNPLVDFELNPREMQFPFTNVQIENLSNPDLISYQWDFGDNLYEYQSEWFVKTEHIYDTWGTYKIILNGTSNHSCKAQFSDSVIIHETDTINDIAAGFILYPNPARDFIRLTSKINLNDAVIEIQNAWGQNVYFISTKRTNNLTELDITELAIGWYILKLKINDYTIWYKFIKN